MPDLRSAPAPLTASAAPVDSHVDSAYLLREVCALWGRLRNPEDDVDRLSRGIRLMNDDLEMLVNCAETAQRQFRIWQPRRAR